MIDDDDPLAQNLKSDRLPLDDGTQDDEALARALQNDLNGSGHRLARSKSGGTRRRRGGSGGTADEALARKLQSEEYAGGGSPRNAPTLDWPAAYLGDLLEMQAEEFISAPRLPRGYHRRRRSSVGDDQQQHIPVGGQQLRLDSYEDLLKLDELNGVVKKGLSNSQLKALPLVPFQKGTKSDDECKCFVCFETFGNGEKVMLLPCLHAYHGPCIAGWLKDNKSCPVCRQEIRT